MQEPRQKYRMTFKCGCGNTFKLVTTNALLESAPCPACTKKKKKEKITRFARMGDGPISESEVKPSEFRKAPNVIYRCDTCHSLTKILEEVGDKSLTECPACDASGLKYVGHISRDTSTAARTQNKAIDLTADIVMQDHKLTNLQDSSRVGESMAPKIEPRLQAQADGFFGAKKKGGNIPFDPAKLARSAMAGKLRDPRSYRDPVAAIQPRYKPSVNIVAGDGIGRA